MISEINTFSVLFLLDLSLSLKSLTFPLWNHFFGLVRLLCLGFLAILIQYFIFNTFFWKLVFLGFYLSPLSYFLSLFYHVDDARGNILNFKAAYWISRVVLPFPSLNSFITPFQTCIFSYICYCLYQGYYPFNIQTKNWESSLISTVPLCSYYSFSLWVLPSLQSTFFFQSTVSGI